MLLHSHSTAAADLIKHLPEYVRNNAGKAFEFMVDAVNEDREKAGLGSAEELRQVKELTLFVAEWQYMTLR
jgi:hypothetical protein